MIVDEPCELCRLWIHFFRLFLVGRCCVHAKSRGAAVCMSFLSPLNTWHVPIVLFLLVSAFGRSNSSFPATFLLFDLVLCDVRTFQILSLSYLGQRTFYPSFPIPKSVTFLLPCFTFPTFYLFPIFETFCPHPFLLSPLNFSLPLCRLSLSLDLVVPSLSPNQIINV